MTNKIGGIQETIEKALMILQNSDSTEEEFAEIKKALTSNRKEVYRHLQKKLHKITKKELITIIDLLSILEEDAFIPLMKEVFYRIDIDLSLKEKIAQLLEKLNSPLSPQLIKELTNSQSLYQKFASAIKKGQSRNIKKKDLEGLQEGSEFLHFSLLNQLINETLAGFTLFF